MSYFDRITSIENLMLAWKKLERSFHHGEVWYDELDLAAFKFRLTENLIRIKNEIENGTYAMEAIVPAPYPKANEKPKDGEKLGKMRIRQSFQIDIRDQLVWMAITNVIGEVFERLMPAWSYGNRLYVPIWKDPETKQLKVGYYRSSNPRIYKKWSNSWPLMRKHISVSIKQLAKVNLNEDDNSIVEDNNQISDDYFKLPYLTKEYFNNADSKQVLFWTGLDLSKFYEKVDMRRIASMIKDKVKEEDEETTIKLHRLIDSVTNFKVSLYTFDEEKDYDALKDMQLEDYENFHGLPTGLEVAGFIANVYMLDIDLAVKRKLATKEFKNLIHFRYVDDHVFIAREPETLYKWVMWYKKLITSAPFGLQVNEDKVEPQELGSAYDESKSEDEAVGLIRQFGAISPNYPAPLLTMAMKKVSQIAKQDLSLMTESERGMMFKDLQMLLVSDLPEQEIKHNTRISFATTMLTRMMLSDMVDYNEIYRLRKLWVGYVDGLNEDKFKNLKDTYKDYIFNDAQLIMKMEGDADWTYIQEINKELARAEQHRKNMVDEIYNLLIRAVNEVPDKPRVWLRAFEFCAHHCPKKIREIYNLIRSFAKEKKMHPLGCDYIEATLNIHRAEMLLMVMAELRLKGRGKTEHEKAMMMDFIVNACAISDSVSTHYFVLDSLLQVHKAIAFCYLVNKEEQIIPFGSAGIDYLDSVGKYDPTFWMLLIHETLNGRRMKVKNVIKELFPSDLNKVSVNSPYFPYFLGVFISEPLELDYFEFDNPEGLVLNHEDLKYFVASMDGYSDYLGKICQADKLHRDLNKKDSTYWRFCQWIDYAKQIQRDDPNYRLLPIWSEFVSVKIMIALINYLHSDKEQLFKLKAIHPANIKFSQKEWKKRYNDWNFWINDENSVTVKIDYLVEYSRVYQLPAMMSINGPDYNMVYALGLFFLQLLVKEKSLPWIMNRPEYGFEWMSVLDDLIHKGRVSSLTSRIVTSCLSVRNRENRILRQDTGTDLNDLYWVDNPKIWNVDDLLEQLKKDLELLKTNLVSVANSQQRQVIVIDLE